MKSNIGTVQADTSVVWQPSLSGRPLTGLTILVVEDSRIASEAVRLLCLRSGARIRRADCLRSAARHLGAYRPTVVIVDLGLPDGNGAELIRTIAHSEPRTPVILGMSGDPDAKAVAMAAGADGFLAKPVENLALFQQTILAALAEPATGPRLRLLPDEVVQPDPVGLRQDLSHVADVLARAHDTAAIDYIAQFLAGVARSSHDDSLADAAMTLASDYQAGRALAANLARISGLVQDRLSSVGDA